METITVENNQGPPGTPYDSATPRLNTLKKFAHLYTKTCTRVFIAVLYIIIKTRNNPSAHQLQNGMLLAHSYDRILHRTENEKTPVSHGRSSKS